MSDAVEKLVLSTKARLNSVYSTAAGFDWAWKAALGGVAVILPLRFMGLGREGIVLWVFLVGAAAFMGYVRSLPKRLDSAGAARWLDEKYGDMELLSAALVCIERQNSGSFDGEIVESAEAFAAAAPPLKMPLRAFILKSSWVAALCVACLAVLFLAGPARAGKMKGLSFLESGDTLTGILGDAALKPEAFPGKEAKELAQRLFPNDKRMASLTERALLDGRMDDLRKLLERAQRDFEKEYDKAASDLDRQMVNEEMTLFQQALRSQFGSNGERSSEGDRSGSPVPQPGDGGDSDDGLPGSDSADGLAQNGDRPPGSDGTPDGTSGQGGQGADKGNGQSGQNGQQRGSSSSGSDGTDAGTGKSQRGESGKKPGVGRGFDSLKLDYQLGSAKDTGTLDLGPDDPGEMGQMVLPELPGGGAVTRAALDPTRSSEAIIRRTDLPLEYRDYARSYFIRLTEGEEE